LNPPQGFTINPSTGQICGTFANAGIISFFVKVADQTGRSTTKIFSVDVAPPLQITTKCPLKTGKVGENYSDFFTATGGRPPYTWQILPQIYVADYSNNKIKKFSENGTILTYAGNGAEASVDGDLTTSSFNNPYGLTFDSYGNLYVADRTKIRKISSNGSVTTLPGTFNNPEDMVVDDSGNTYVSESASKNTISKIDSQRNVFILAGKSNNEGFVDGVGSAALFRNPQGISWALDGTMILTDMGNHAIRKISVDGAVSTIAGNHLWKGYVDGPLNIAKFDGPHDVKVADDGNIYVLDHSNGCIRKITPQNSVVTIGSKNNLTTPYCLFVDKSGYVYVSDGATNHDIRRLNPDGSVSIIAGGGAGDVVNCSPLLAKFKSPRGIEINPYEDLPTGLSLNATSGEISGVPKKFGQYSINYRVTDSCGNVAVSECKLEIPGNDENPFNNPFGKISGNVYNWPNVNGWPDGDLKLLTRSELNDIIPITKINSLNFNIPLQAFDVGFPGFPNLKTWFQIKFDGHMNIPVSGQYQFKLTSDDNSTFRIFGVNNQQILDYSNLQNESASIFITQGIYRFELDYGQGPPNFLALQLFWKVPGEDIFKIVPQSIFVASPSE
jgi:sugar lactone lactonase YvrE